MCKKQGFGAVPILESAPNPNPTLLWIVNSTCNSKLWCHFIQFQKSRSTVQPTANKYNLQTNI